MGVTQQQVVSLLENVLFESATQAGAEAATWEANPAATSLTSLASAMANSGEEKIAATVVGFYLTSLGRAPTAAEIRYYVGIAEQGLTTAQISAGDVSNGTWDTIASYFSHSPEFTTRAGLDYSLGITGALLEAVPFLYEAVLGRTPSTVEIAYYDNQIVSGSGLGVLFREFTASPEFHTDTDSQIAAALATYGTDVASGQTPPTTIGSSVTLGTPAPPPPAPTPAPAPTWGVLTTGTDTINDTAMTGTHTYSAIISTTAGATLNATDHLTGNGLATLAITDSDTGATALMPGATLSGIETVTLTITDGNAGTDSSHPFDLSGVSGLTSFTVTSSGTLGDFLDTGSASSVSITTQGAGDTVEITSDSLVTLSLAGTLVGVSLTDAGGSTSLTVDVDGVTLSSGFTDSSNHITSLTITGSGSASNIASISDTALTSLTVSGDVALGSSGAPIVLGVNSFSVSGSDDTGSVSISVVLTGTSGTDGGNVNASGAGFGGDGASGGTAGGGTITLGGGADNLADHGIGGAGGNGGSVTAGGGGAGNGGIGGAGGTAGNETITLGNGGNILVIDSTGGDGGIGGAATVTGGGGAIAGDGGGGGNGGHDTITLGDGSNTVTDNSQGGNGGNGGAASATGGGAAIGGDGGGGGDGGHNTITVGNGTNTITDDSVGGSGGASGSATIAGNPGSAGAGGNDVITVGTGHNTIDLGNHGNDTVIVGVDAGFSGTSVADAQVIEHATTGDKIGFALDTTGLTITSPSISTTDTDTLINFLETNVQGSPKTAAFGTDGTNSYIVETHNGNLNAASTVIIEITGVHTITATADYVVLAS